MLKGDSLASRFLHDLDGILVLSTTNDYWK